MSTDFYNQHRTNFKFVGSVGRSMSNFVTTKRNKNTGRCSYIDDASSLTKKAKGEIVRFFSSKENKRKDIAYLVVPRSIVQSKKSGKEKS